MCGLILAGGFVQDIFVQLGEGTIHSQPDMFRSTAAVMSLTDPASARLRDRRPGGLVDATSTTTEVRESMSRLNFQGLLNNGHSDLAVAIEGVEPGKEALVATSAA